MSSLKIGYSFIPFTANRYIVPKVKQDYETDNELSRQSRQQTA